MIPKRFFFMEDLPPTLLDEKFSLKGGSGTCNQFLKTSIIQKRAEAIVLKFTYALKVYIMYFYVLLSFAVKF